MKLKKSLGQHFLKNTHILEREAKAISPKNMVILEIGGGDGRLSEKILSMHPKKLYIVEKDSEFVEVLKKKFSENPDVVVIHGDFLDLDIPKDVDIIVGNIPYYISAPIIFRLKDFNISSAYLMVQKEFGKKMVAKPGDPSYGRLSVTSQLFFDIKILFYISRKNFQPVPKVDSVFLRLVPKHLEISKEEEELINKMFQLKNKKLKNSLRISGRFADLRPRHISPKEVLKVVKDIIKTKKKKENE